MIIFSYVIQYFKMPSSYYLQVELIFVAREDMLPTKLKSTSKSSISNCDDDNDGLLLRVEMTDNLTVGVVGGTYGGEMNTTLKRHSDHHSAGTAAAVTILNPLFDVGSGPPDMVISLNAGLYAYESWRNVVEYLSYNKSVVGVFTDYNEYSGVHCAGLGGGKFFFQEVMILFLFLWFILYTLLLIVSLSNYIQLFSCESRITLYQSFSAASCYAGIQHESSTIQ